MSEDVVHDTIGINLWSIRLEEEGSRLLIVANWLEMSELPLKSVLLNGGGALIVSPTQYHVSS
jgi:hypothetical protein